MNPERSAIAAGLLWVLAGAVLGGCIPSEPLDAGAIDTLWRLSPEATDGAKLYKLDVNGQAVPTHWTVHRSDSVILSTVSMIRAVDAVEQGRRKAEFSLSEVYAQTLVEILREVRTSMVQLRDLTEVRTAADRRRWADALAEVLVKAEYVTRLATVDPNGPPGRGEPRGLAAGPMLEMLTAYLNQRSGGRLLSDLSTEEVRRLRSVITQLVLRLGFAAAGKRQPGDLRETLVEQMARAEQIGQLQKPLAEKLDKALAASPPGRAEQQLGDALQSALQTGPKVLEAIESLISQWHKVQKLEVKLLRPDRSPEAGPVLLSRLHVKPGQEVRIAEVMMLQPTVAFRGQSRMIVIPEDPVTDATIVKFGPVGDGGGVDMRFGGLLGLVRVFAFPLASGPLREVRVFSGEAHGRSLTHVEVMTEDASAGSGDPRRMMVVQSDSRWRHVRTATEVRKRYQAEVTSFSYITPQRRWSYTHKGTEDE